MTVPLVRAESLAQERNCDDPGSMATDFAQVHGAHRAHLAFESAHVAYGVALRAAGVVHHGHSV